MEVFFITIAVGLSGEPAHLVVESFLTGVGQRTVSPVSKNAFEVALDGLGHSFETADAGGAGFFAPK